MSSVREVASAAGVSIGTVSRVMNERPGVSQASRDKVFSAIARSGYRTPAATRRGNSVVAMVATGGRASLNSPYNMAILSGVSEGVEAGGHDLMIIDAQRSRRSGETDGQMLRRKGVRGALLRTNDSSRSACEALAAEGFPAVVLAERFDNPAVATCGVSASRACVRGIEHLLHLGHRRIAITLNAVDDHDHAERHAAYREALTAAGMTPDDRCVMRVPATRDAGAVALRQIRGMPRRPTAVFCTDPLAAAGLLNEALRMGVRVPEELSVLGFDDTDVRFGVYPRMTAVCQDAEALGRVAMGKLQRLMDADPPAGDAPAVAPLDAGSVLECWLEIHDTTAPPA